MAGFSQRLWDVLSGVQVQHIMWILGIVVSAIAACFDWRSRRIPNWFTLSAFGLGLTLNTAVWGWHGMRNSLAGATIPLIVLLPLVALRGLGAGDWKLMGALGAILGWAEIIMVLLASAVVAGIIATVQLIRQRRAGATVANLWELLRGFFLFGFRPNPVVSLDNPQASTLPFGVAAAAATLICYGLLVVSIRKHG